MVQIPWFMLLVIFLAGGLSGWVFCDWIMDDGDEETPVEEIK